MIPFIFWMFSFISMASEGTNAVSLPDGSVVIADVFVEEEIFQPFQRPKRISLNPRLKLQAMRYAEFFDQRIRQVSNNESSSLSFFIDLSKFEQSYIYVVKDQQELRRYCAHGRGKSYRPAGDTLVTDYACSMGKEIFLIEGKFRELNLKDQALLLMHEKATTMRDIDGGRDFELVGTFFNDSRILLDVSYRQQQGNNRKLSPTEYEMVDGFYRSSLDLVAFYFSKTLERKFRVSENGGGLIFGEGIVEDGAFLGVGSVISGKVHLLAGSQIVGSLIKGNSTLFAGVRVINSKLIQKNESSDLMQVGEGTVIRESDIRLQVIDLGKDSEIDKSTIFCHSLKTGKNFKFKLSKIGPDYWHRLSLTLTDNQSLQNGQITDEDQIRGIPFGYQIVDLNFTLENVLTPCSGLSEQEVVKNSRNCIGISYDKKEMEEWLRAIKTDSAVIQPTKIRNFKMHGIFYSVIDSFNFSANIHASSEDIHQGAIEAPHYMVYNGHFFRVKARQMTNLKSFEFRKFQFSWAVLKDAINRAGGEVLNGHNYPLNMPLVKE